MEPNFALTLSFDGIALLHRGAGGIWDEVGAVPLDTEDLAGELAAKHITVNAIAPGVFPSRMTTFVLKDEKMAEQQRNAVPLGRLGEPEDMEGLAVFLSSQAGAYITGNVIALDGGTAVKSPDIL